MAGKALSIVQQLNSEAKASGLGEYVGSVILLSVNLRKDVLLSDIVTMMENDARINNKWTPEPINHLTLYLSIMSSLNKASLSRFEYDEATFPFSPEEHGGYLVTRLFKRSKTSTPTAHKVFHLERDVRVIRDNKGNITDRIIKDVKADDGIIIKLDRTVGNHVTDVPRGGKRSQFEIEITGNNDDRYAPFLETLYKEFDDKRNEKYSSEQVRELILDLIRNKLEALSITRGNYFLEDDKMDALDALREGFQSLDEGIQFIVLHQFRGQPGSKINESFSGLVRGVSDAVIKEVQDLHKELMLLDDKDSKTRESTWDDRADKLKKLEQRTEKLKQKQLIESDIMEELFETCYKKIKESKTKLVEDM